MHEPCVAPATAAEPRKRRNLHADLLSALTDKCDAKVRKNFQLIKPGFRGECYPDFLAGSATRHALENHRVAEVAEQCAEKPAGARTFLTAYCPDGSWLGLTDTSRPWKNNTVAVCGARVPPPP